MYRLLQLFLERQFKAQGKTPKPLSDSAIDVLRNYDWPGNVRELENVGTYLAALCDEQSPVIGVDELPFAVRQGATPISVNQKHIESDNAPGPKDRHRNAYAPARPLLNQQTLAEALQAHGGHRESVTKHFGVSRMTLWRRMKEFGLD